MQNFYDERSGVTGVRIAAFVVTLLDIFQMFAIVYFAYFIRSFSEEGLSDQSLYLLAFTVPHATTFSPGIASGFSHNVNTGLPSLALGACVFALFTDAIALGLRLGGVWVDNGNTFRVFMEVMNVVWLVLDVVRGAMYLQLIRQTALWVVGLIAVWRKDFGSDAQIAVLNKVSRSVYRARKFFRFALYIIVFVILGFAFIAALGMMPPAFYRIFWTNIMILFTWCLFYAIGGSLRFPPADASSNNEMLIITAILTSADLALCTGGFIYRIISILSDDPDVFQQIGGWLVIAMTVVLIFIDIAALALIATIYNYTAEVARTRALPMKSHERVYKMFERYGGFSGLTKEE
jgi:hypothetical protein